MNAPSRTPTIMSSRDFDQDTARAKRAAADGPVFITDEGSRTYVLLTKEEYERLEKGETPAKKPFRSLAEALAQTEGGDFDFEFPELKGPSTLRIPDFED